jgi:hypothetical protein
MDLTDLVRAVSARTAARRALGWMLLLGVGMAVAVRPAAGGEGGSSHYNPGTMGDFAMALIGPAGFYLRNDAFYFDGSIGEVSLGKAVLDHADQQAWVNITKGIYLAPWGILGSRFGAVVSFPVIFDAKLSGELAFPNVQGEGSRGGFGDMSFTSFLNWSKGQFHTNVGLNVYAPTGYYNPDSIINLGRNYWSFDPTLTFTWLHPERGHEISFIAGTMFNTENHATDYTSGDEFHLGFMVAQHFSPKFAVGVTGYYYRQFTDDEGPLVDQLNALGRAGNGFRGEGMGLGPAVLYTPKIFGKDVNLIAKWLHDLDTTNRFDGDRVFLSVAFGF